MRTAFMLLLLGLGWDPRLSQGGALPPRDVAWQGETMGTTYSIKVARAPLTDADLERLKTEVDGCLNEVNRQMSHYRPDSELTAFNQSRSTEPFPVSSNFAVVARFAVALHRQSQGAFDPTLGPLINVWGFGQSGERFDPPAAASVAAARQIVGCQHLRVTGAGALQKDLPPLQLNLSAVAKGFGVDEVARVLRARGLTNVFVEVGGEVAAFGLNMQQQSWRVGVEAPNPGSLQGEELEAIISLRDTALATSGDYRRFFTDAQGRQYAHLLDPRTGQPVRHDLVSVSVLADNCLRADGLATTLFVLGPEAGPRWIETQINAAALFMVRAADGRLKKFVSSRFPAWIDCQAPPQSGTHKASVR